MSTETMTDAWTGATPDTTTAATSGGTTTAATSGGTTTHTPIETRNADPALVAKELERKGRRWLIWSFIFCPCHLPLSMAVLASIFGGSAFGALVSRNALGTGIVLGTIYAIGVGIGFRYLRKATKGIDCSDGSCTI